VGRVFAFLQAFTIFWFQGTALFKDFFGEDQPDGHAGKTKAEYKKCKKEGHDLQYKIIVIRKQQ